MVGNKADSSSSEDSNYLEQAKKEIRIWESEGPGYIARIGDAILWPAQKALKQLIPKGVQDAVVKALVSCLSQLSSASQWTVDDKAIAKKVSKKVFTQQDDLKAADEAAKHYWNWNVSYAVAEGAGTGAAGLPGLAADIPLLFGISLRSIQQIATCYGYDINDEAEQEYILQILRVGSTGDLRAKMEFLISLKQVEQILLKVTWKKMNESLAKKEISKISLLAAMRRFAKSLGIQITKRKALQMVPIVGALIGGAFNGTFVNDVCRAAYMSYRRRKIAELEGNVPNGKED